MTTKTILAFTGPDGWGGPLVLFLILAGGALWETQRWRWRK